MGSDNSNAKHKKRLLSVQQIKQEQNQSLIDLFQRYKNADGLLTLKELTQMTNYLLSDAVMKKIIKICCSIENKLTYYDLLYFIALLKTNDFEIRINFILAFIFFSRDNLIKEKYISKVKKFFYESTFLLNILLNDEILKQKDKIYENKVYNFIKNNYQIEIENYQLNKEIYYMYNINNYYNFEIDHNNDPNYLASAGNTIKSAQDEEDNVPENKNNENNNNENNNNDNKNNENNNNNSEKKKITEEPKKLFLIKKIKYCNCVNRKASRSSSVTSSRINSSQFNEFDVLLGAFSRYKKFNNNIFPLNLFEDMLNQVRIIPSFIEVICNYIKKKTEKSILSFEIFKEILSILTIPVEENEQENKKEITRGLFKLFSYPENYIERSYFFHFIQSTKKDYSEKVINNLLNNNHIEEKITKEKFTEIVDYILNELTESLEHAKFIPYIFFNILLPDRKMEKKCVDILLGKKTIEEYLTERIPFEEKFYVIDSKFWNNWKFYMTTPFLDNFKNLRIDTKSICDKSGKIIEGLAYSNDYKLLPENLYKLFCSWYGIPELELEREKIYTDENEPFFDDEEEIIYNNKNFFYEDIKTKQKCEIEVNPVFLLFLNFEQILIDCNGSLEKFKKIVQNKIDKKDSTYYKFSRKEKFKSFLTVLENALDKHLDENNAKLWLFYMNRFEIIPFEDTLEKQGIFNQAVIILEIYKNGIWPSQKIDGIHNEKLLQIQSPLVGLLNVGNSCYMNSVLQIFLNIDVLRNIFARMKIQEDTEFFNFIVNKKSNKKKLIIEFINLLRAKWVERKKTLNPKKFKEICGKYNITFAEYFQQDAYDFLTFLLNNLHEGTNLKNGNIKVTSQEKIDTTEQELANEYWSNTIRNNLSYIYGLFMGQLQSKLICNECKNAKYKYEPFGSLDLPIPEQKDITLNIILFRLPITLSPFFLYERRKETLKTSKINSEDVEFIRDKLQNIKNKKMGRYLEKEESNISLKDQTFGSMSEANMTHGNFKDNMISNELNLSIPITLKIDLCRDNKCSKIIEVLKSMSELSLDKDSLYTKFIIVSNDHFISPDSIIDDTLLPEKSIFIYEILNFTGIKKVFGYADIEKNKIKQITDKEILYSINSINNDQQITKITKITNKKKINKSTKNINNNNISENENIENDDSSENELKEILIEINHRYHKNQDLSNYLFNIPTYIELKTYPDYIILCDKKSIKPLNLYEMIWEKYNYFLDVPSRYEKKLWWKNVIANNKNMGKHGLKYCSPFVLKILNKNTSACSFCPWFKFCTGCIINPKYNDYISIPKNSCIIVEWCVKIKGREIKDSNPFLVLNYSPINKNLNNDIINETSLYDCLDLYTQDENLTDVICEHCKQKRNFTKVLKIERIPEYLMIIFKRFKYTATYSKKIDALINFPIDNLDLKKYLTIESNENLKRYDLFGIINHSGDISHGHYTCSVREGTSWVNYDDSIVKYVKGKLDIKYAYILIYKLNEEEQQKKFFQLNFYGLIDTAFRIYLNQINFQHLFNYIINEKGEIEEEFDNDCQYYYGEPVTVNNSKGYLINVYKNNNEEIYAKVKIKIGYLNVKVLQSKLIKESVKDVDDKNDKSDDNIENKKSKEKGVGCNDKCNIY